MCKSKNVWQIEEPHLNKEVREKYKELQQKYEDGNVR